MDAFDSDAIIYAANPGHPLGSRVLALLERTEQRPAGLGSVLLLPEVLSKPTRLGQRAALAALQELLGRLDLRETDRATATLAAALGATYALKTADAVHLATAIRAGATRFVTNNRRDFGGDIEEIEIVFPDDPDLLPSL